MLLSGELNSGDRLIVGAEDGELTFEVIQGAAAFAGQGGE
jgi:hypothetical protein